MGCEECFRGAGGKPSCGACSKPILDEENIGVWQIWHMLQMSPVVAGMGVYMGADLQLAHIAFDYLEIPVHERMFWLTRMLLLNAIACKLRNKKD